MLRLRGRRVWSGVITAACWRTPMLRPPEHAAVTVLSLLPERDVEPSLRPTGSGQRDPIGEHRPSTDSRHSAHRNDSRRADEAERALQAHGGPPRRHGRQRRVAVVRRRTPAQALKLQQRLRHLCAATDRDGWPQRRDRRSPPQLRKRGSPFGRAALPAARLTDTTRAPVPSQRACRAPPDKPSTTRRATAWSLPTIRKAYKLFISYY